MRDQGNRKQRRIARVGTAAGAARSQQHHGHSSQLDEPTCQAAETVGLRGSRVAGRFGTTRIDHHNARAARLRLGKSSAGCAAFASSKWVGLMADERVVAYDDSQINISRTRLAAGHDTHATRGDPFRGLVNRHGREEIGRADSKFPPSLWVSWEFKGGHRLLLQSCLISARDMPIVSASGTGDPGGAKRGLEGNG